MSIFHQSIAHGAHKVIPSILAMSAILLFTLGLYSSVRIVGSHQTPGFDHWDTISSARQLLIFKESLHDPARTFGESREKGSFIKNPLSFIRQRLDYVKNRGISTIQSHPVYMAMLVLFLCNFDLPQATILYNHAQVFSLLAACLILAIALSRIYKQKATPFFVSAFFFFLVTLDIRNSPFLINLDIGQTNLLILPLLALFVFFLTIGRNFFSGFFLGVAVGDKILPLLLIAAVPRSKLVRVIWGMAFYFLFATMFLYLWAGKVVLLDLIEYPFILLSSNYYPFSQRDPLFLAPWNNSMLDLLGRFFLMLATSPALALLVITVLVFAAVIFYQPESPAKAYSILMVAALVACAILLPKYWQVSVVFCSVLLVGYCIRRISRVSKELLPSEGLLLKVAFVVTFLFPIFFRHVYSHHLILFVIPLLFYSTLLMMRPKVCSFLLLLLLILSTFLLGASSMAFVGTSWVSVQEASIATSKALVFPSGALGILLLWIFSLVLLFSLHNKGRLSRIHQQKDPNASN